MYGPIWQRVGPTFWRGDAPESYQSGAMNQVSIDPQDRNTIYASSFDGGLWRLPRISDYPRFLWEPLTDREDTLRTSSFAIAPSDSRILYLADGLGRILRSDNRGTTWRSVTGSNRFNYVSKILVHPSRPNTVYVASDRRDRIWVLNGRSGFWKSENADESGSEWTEILSGEVSDAAMDPGSPSIIYVGIRGQGLFKTSNAHQSRIRWEGDGPIYPFSRVILPPNADPYGHAATTIKISLGRHGNDANRLVAVKFHKQLFINRRGGRERRGRHYAWEREAWEPKGDRGQEGYALDQSNYDNVIAVDPFDNNILLTGLQDLYRHSVGANGAENWQKVAGSETNVHPDQLCIEFDPDPAQNGVAYLANDGGIYRSGDRGLNWSELNRGLYTGQITGGVAMAHNVAIASFYHQGLCGSEDVRSDTSEWRVYTGGSHEFSASFADPKRPNIFYIFQDPHLERHRYPRTGIPAEDIVQIGNFNARAMAVDTRPNSDILLSASIEPTAIKRALNGDSNTPTWTDEIVDMLSSSDQIISITFAPSNPGMAYALSKSGKVYRKDDVSSSSTWTYQGSLNTTSAKQIVVNSRHHDRIYVISNDTISLSEHDGSSFRPIHGSGNRALPTSREFKSLVAHPLSSGTLYLATEVGVFVTLSEGRYWDRFDSGLPNVVITNLSLDGSVYAATMGRGLWKTRAPLFFP